MKLLEGKRVVITGGTGSLGKTLVRRLLSGEIGEPAKLIVFSRDEAKQHYMRVEYEHRVAATDELIYRNFQRKLEFRIGDVRDLDSVVSVLRGADVVVNAAALKQVPTYEYFSYEAVQTNIGGAENIVRAIRQVVTCIRPGEKIHEILVSEEEAFRTVQRGSWYAIRPMLPEVAGAGEEEHPLRGEYGSGSNVMSLEETRRLLEVRGLLVSDATPTSELLA